MSPPGGGGGGPCCASVSPGIMSAAIARIPIHVLAILTFMMFMSDSSASTPSISEVLEFLAGAFLGYEANRLRRSIVAHQQVRRNAAGRSRQAHRHSQRRKRGSRKLHADDGS